MNLPGIEDIEQSYWGIILGMGSDNERWCYIEKMSLIGWAHPQNDSCYW